MKTIIYYYTGTGNTLWTARQLAAELGNTDLKPMKQFLRTAGNSSADVIGIVFPVHIWGIPGLVLRFIEQMEKNSSSYYFAVAVNAGQVSRTLIQLKNFLTQYGIILSAGYDIVLPSNYIPWGGPGPEDKQKSRFIAAAEKIKQMVKVIKAKEMGPIEKGPLWQRVIFTLLYKMAFSKIHQMDGKFWTDDKCNHCGICAKVCPVQNIEMQNDKPVWQHNCEQCLACIQWCPMQSIQYGPKTPAYPRYQNPEIKLSDVL